MSQPSVTALPFAPDLANSGSEQAFVLHPPTEAAVTQRLFRLNWLLLAAMLAVLDLSLLATDFRIRPMGYLGALAIAALYGVFGHIHARSPRARLWTSSMLTGIAQ